MELRPYGKAGKAILTRYRSMAHLATTSCEPLPMSNLTLLI